MTFMSEEPIATRHAGRRPETRASAAELFDGLREGVCLLTADGALLFANRAARRFLSLDGAGGNAANGKEDEPADLPEANGFLPAGAWQTLREEAPAAVHVDAGAGPLTIESRRREWLDQSVVQLIINPARDSDDPAGVEAQLTALARISRELNATLHLDDILHSVLHEALQHTGASGGQISIFEAGGALQQRLREGSVAPTPEHDGRVVDTQQSAIVANLPAGKGGPDLRSALITPILFGGEVAGLIHLFAGRSNFFTPQTETFITTLANYAAIAIGNAHRFAEIKERNTLLQRRTQQIEQFVETSRVFHSDRPLEEVYEDLVYAIQEGVGFNVVLLSLAEREGTGWTLQQITAAGLPLEQVEELRGARRPWDQIEQLMQPDYALGNAYLVPAGEAPEAAHDLILSQAADLYPAGDSDLDDAWQDGDLFFIPMRDSRDQPLALISLAAPLDGRRPGLNTARVLEIFANQAANAVENVQLFHNMRDYAIELQQLHNVSQQTLREPDFDAKLQWIVEGLQIAGWGRVALTLRDEAFNATKLVTAGVTDEEHAYLAANMLPGERWQARFNSESFQRFRQGSSYLIPHDAEEARETIQLDDEPAGAPAAGDANRWHPNDALVRPLYDQQGRPVGLISLDQPQDGRRPSERALQTIDLYAQFATSVIVNYRLFSEMEQRSEELQTLFDASRALSGTLDEDAVLTAMGEHMLQAVDADAYTIYALRREKEDAVVLNNRSQIAGLDAAAPGAVFDVNRLELARRVIDSREPVTRYVPGEEAAQAAAHPALQGAHSVAMLPLTIGDELYGIVEVLCAGERNRLTEEKLKLLGAILNQSSTALETVHLFEELDERVARRTLALAEEVAKVQSILESIADGVLVAEADGEIVMANMPTANILDTPRESLIGKTVHELMGLYGESGDEWVRTIETWAERAAVLDRRTSLKNRLEIEEKIVLVHVAPVFANDSYFGTISIFRDVTKEVEVDRMKSEFVSTVSHELRTPMTSIKGYADLMLMGAAGKLTPPQLRYLQVIKNNADRLKALVNDLLDISRIETGKTQLKLQPVDIAQLITDVVNEHARGRIQHEQIEIDLSTSIAPSLPLANADHDKITRVLTNLVDNALNYTPAGGEVEIEAGADGAFVVVSVRDTGIGISPEYHEKIFDRFFRVEESQVQAIPGTGLGLSIVRSLVEMHGGEMTLTSEPGRGSTFTFTLPLVVDDNEMV